MVSPRWATNTGRRTALHAPKLDELIVVLRTSWQGQAAEAAAKSEKTCPTGNTRGPSSINSSERTHPPGPLKRHRWIFERRIILAGRNTTPSAYCQRKILITHAQVGHAQSTQGGFYVPENHPKEKVNHPKEKVKQLQTALPNVDLLKPRWDKQGPASI